MIKLVAIDMDDTVLNAQLEISERTKAAIRAAVAKGAAVTFATGRMYCSCRRFALELGLDVPLITYNGALIQQAISGAVLYHQPVPITVAAKVTQWAEEHRHHLQLYVGDRVYVSKCNDKALWYGKHSGVEVYDVGSLTSFLTVEPTKMLMMVEILSIDGVMEELYKLCGTTIHMSRSKPTFLELVHPQVSKGHALAYLANLLGVERSAVMAIGDGCNDLEMLEYAGLSVAMGNADPRVKEQADYITDTNEQDGVAKAIEKFILNGNGVKGE
jgi:Cof subfamily protein (haloacid dehalogenase superfamily)